MVRQTWDETVVSWKLLSHPDVCWMWPATQPPCYMSFFLPLQNDDLRNLSLSGHVGFDSLPDQLVNKSTSQGFCFNILCVGKLFRIMGSMQVHKLASYPKGKIWATIDFIGREVTAYF